ncbi:MAG: hypothetical protein HY270_16755 [Deltaproteobacteria bacterium]|nr:hypothetical protein [Deltaproteobacteria bacterium]
MLFDLWKGPTAVDDAFITLRYARSLAEGNGFAYNLGQPVLGTTTPLFALLVAFLHTLIGVDYTTLAFAIAVIAHAASAVLLAILGARYGHSLAGWVAGLLLAVAPLMIAVSVGCMETSLFILLTLWVLLPRGGHPALSADVAAALAVLVRPEGVLTAALHLFRAAGSGRLRRACTVLAAVILPWAAFATYYFGSPVPNSVVAKWRIRGSSSGMIEGFWNAMASTFLGFDTMFMRLTEPLVWQLWGLRIVIPYPLLLLNLASGLLLLSAGVAGMRYLWRHNMGRGLIFFTSAYVGLYVITGPVFFAWYAAPILPLVNLAAAIGVAEILKRRISAVGFRRAAAAIITAAALALAAGQSLRMTSAWPDEREVHYRRIIEWLGPLAQSPSTLIAAMEVGAPGYYSRARMLDLCGLVSPEMADRSIAQAIEQFQPAAVIAAPLGFAETESSPAFQRDYRLAAALPWRLNPFLRTAVFVRRDVAVPAQPLDP